MAEWTGSRRPSRRSWMAEEEKKAMRRVTPDQEEAPGAVVSPQHPGTVPDRSTIPGQWSDRVPAATTTRRPLSEFGTAQHIADVYAPSGEGGVWTPRDFEQSPAPYEELRRADPRLMPPQRPVPGYETARALAQREERAALAAQRTEELAAHAASASDAGGEADHSVSPGQAAEATQPGAISGADASGRRGDAAGTIAPAGAPPTAAEIAEIPSAATPLAAAGAASGPPAPGEISEGTSEPAPPVLPPDQQTTSRTGLAAPAEAVANAAAAVAPPVVPSEPEKVVGTVGAGQAEQDRSRWAEAAPPPGLRTGVAEATETGATGTAAPGIGGGSEASAAPIVPATDEPVDARPVDVTSYDVVGGQLAGLQAAAADVPADIPTPAEGWSAGGGDAVPAGTIPTSAATDAPSGRTGDIAPGGTSVPETGWGTTYASEAAGAGEGGVTGAGREGAPAGEPRGGRRPLGTGESILVVPTGSRSGGIEPAIVAPESEPEPHSARVQDTASEAALAESGVGDAAAVGGSDPVAGPGVAEGGFRPTAAPVARDVEPEGGSIGAGRGSGTALDPTPAPPTPPGSVASVTDAGIVGAEAVPIADGGGTPAGAVRGGGGRRCPPGFPVKAVAGTRAFRLPRSAGYAEMTPEFCFRSADAAAAAGYTPAR